MIETYHRNQITMDDRFGSFIIKALSTDSDNFLKRLNESGNGTFDVTLTMGGIDFSFREVIERILEQHDDDVQRAAADLIAKKYEELYEGLDRIKEILHRTESDIDDERLRLISGRPPPNDG